MTYFDSESMQRVDSPKPSRRAIALSAVLILQAVVTVLTAITMYFRPLSTAACANQCDYPLMFTSVNIYFAVAVPVTLVAVAVTVLLRRRWWALLPPLLATLAVAITFIATDAMARQSIGL